MKKEDRRPKDENGKPHGYWESYYDNGDLYYKGYYIHGKRHGYWEFFWGDNKIDFKGNFIDDEKHGHWGYYWSTGQLMYLQRFVKGYRHGVIIKFSQDGYCISSEFYFMGNYISEVYITPKNKIIL